MIAIFPAWDHFHVRLAQAHPNYYSPLHGLAINKVLMETTLHVDITIFVNALLFVVGQGDGIVADKYIFWRLTQELDRKCALRTA